MIPTEYLIKKAQKREARREKIMWAIVITAVVMALVLIANAGVFAGKSITHYLEALEEIGW